MVILRKELLSAVRTNKLFKNPNVKLTKIKSKRKPYYKRIVCSNCEYFNEDEELCEKWNETTKGIIDCQILVE